MKIFNAAGEILPDRIQELAYKEHAAYSKRMDKPEKTKDHSLMDSFTWNKSKDGQNNLWGRAYHGDYSIFETMYPNKEWW